MSKACPRCRHEMVKITCPAYCRKSNGEFHCPRCTRDEWRRTLEKYPEFEYRIDQAEFWVFVKKVYCPSHVFTYLREQDEYERFLERNNQMMNEERSRRLRYPWER